MECGAGSAIKVLAYGAAMRIGGMFSMTRRHVSVSCALGLSDLNPDDFDQ